MSLLAYGRGTYRRLAAGMPELRLINMYLESAATSQDGVALVQRPGLSKLTTYGEGPIRGVFREAGVLSSAIAAVSGEAVYAPGLVGAMDGAGPVSFGGSYKELLICAGSSIWRTDGSTLTRVTFPDNAGAVALVYIGESFVAIRADSQRFYWSATLDGTSWDALDYASAESAPDNLLDAVVVGDLMYLLGQSTIEQWSYTGAEDLPFSRVEGRNYQRGVLATGCAVALDNTLFWIGDDHRVYRGGSVPEGLSDPAVEERIQASTTVSVFTFELPGHKFFCIRLDTETIAYDVATGEPCEFQSFGMSNWRAQTAAQGDGVAVLGDSIDGTIWTLDPALFTDAGSPVLRLLTAFQPLQDSQTVNNILLDAEFGATPLLVGQGADPQVEIHASRNAGKTWGPWRETSLGRQGEYRHRSVWRRFGTFDAPGAMFEIRTTEPVRLRISAIRANEETGGRSR